MDGDMRCGERTSFGFPLISASLGAASDDFFLSRTALDRRHITASKQLPVAQFRLYISPLQPLSLFYHFGA
jgi:hypothetical protein